MTMETYRTEYRRLHERLALGFAVLAGLLGVCWTFHLAVPWWAVLLLLLAVLIGGAGVPAYYRLKHHPLRGDKRERRYALAQLLTRPVGLGCILAGLLALGMGTTAALAVSPYLVVGGAFLASLPIFFKYKDQPKRA